MMSKEEALLYQKALISSERKRIKELQKQIDLLTAEIMYLRGKLRQQETIKPDLKELAEIARRKRLKKEQKGL